MIDLKQTPAPGGHTIHFRGDSITFTLENHSGQKGQAWLRSNIGYAEIRHAEIIRHAEEGLPPLARDWHDVVMEPVDATMFSITLPLLGVGRFEAKAFFVPEGDDKLLWPEGANSVLKVEPAETCCMNTMYTAFVRQFGASRFAGGVDDEFKPAMRQLDHAGYSVIPKSGTFRDLLGQLDFIVGTLRCRIVQLLPIHPVPTTYARMGRFGSPFAVMDLFNVDPALAEFDKLTTPLEQFVELVDEVHRRDARLYLDMPINHTGWASHLQVKYPEWFKRNADESFKSPGAWGVEWADLSQLDYSHRGLWKYMANVFLFWCRNGVDGFRCDAGYMVPFEAWEYIIAKVRTEYPDAIFMLEGLGGHKHVTERLLADSGMNWAYSELFQNYDQHHVESYLPDAIRVSESKGNLIHFSETHDNARLAAVSPVFARLRCAFCALASHNGAFGFANGVEWYADVQIDVHESHSINWGSDENMIEFIRRLHAILEIHPAFHSGGTVRMIQQGYHNSAVLLRRDASGGNPLLVVANLNHEQKGIARWGSALHPFGQKTLLDLVSGQPILVHRHDGEVSLPLEPGQVVCLSDASDWLDQMATALESRFTEPSISVEQRLRAKAMEISALLQADPQLAKSEKLAEDPKRFCLDRAGEVPCVTTWQWPRDQYRKVMLPPGHFLLVKADNPFVVELCDGLATLQHEKSLPRKSGNYFALFNPPSETPVAHRELTLKMTVFEPQENVRVSAPVMQLCEAEHAQIITGFAAGEMLDRNRFAVCTNNHGALAQVRIAWGELRSKYDGLLAANLDPAVPVDRHLMFPRCRGWLIYRDYSTELTINCQQRFSMADDGTVRWQFGVPVGEGKLVPLEIALRMHPDANAISLTYSRRSATEPDDLEDGAEVTLILRPDIDDRCNHGITKAFAGAEKAWPKAIDAREKGFCFAPDKRRVLHVELNDGAFFSAPEWYYCVGMPVDAERGMDAETDLFSPGYFSASLEGGDATELRAYVNDEPDWKKLAEGVATQADSLSIEETMRLSMQQFIVKRDAFKTVIAGYPWFLDWGRDTLICLRGIIAAGMLKESRDILKQFAKFERNGTIPNMIRGNDDNNRETSDAPLWFFVACNELMHAEGNRKLLEEDCGGRTLKEILISIATGYINGTENGIQMDWNSGLIFSPSHYTWMDTNYPAGTPREGYPIEIQALWNYALRLLAEIDPATSEWTHFAKQVEAAIHTHYVIHTDHGAYLADNLSAVPHTPASEAQIDDALRCNQLFAVTLGAVTDESLARNMIDACEQLLIPGAIRSLADRPVNYPAAVHRGDGSLLNDPYRPYWGIYSGDEDTRRKPAYHNGTAWTWPFPSYAEALVIAYGEPARPTAQAILASSTDIINNGCLRHSPEVLDGNAPHTQRGCGAQAWGATELFRVMKLTRMKG